MGAFGWPHLLILLIIALMIALPLFAIIPRARRRQAAIESGQLVLQDRTNVLGIVAFVLSFFVSIAAIILGHISLGQIKRTNERGWGLAIASLWLGYAGLSAGILGVILAIIVASISH